MSVQRWSMSTVHGHSDAEGEWVTYADHAEALAEAEQRGREEAYNEIPAIAVYGERLRSEGYDVGYTDALAAAREAVAAQGIVTANLIRLDAALAAIDALKGEQT